MNKFILEAIEKIAYKGICAASWWYIYQPKKPDCLEKRPDRDAFEK